MLERVPQIYYYVPPCPACLSRKTGRYVRQPLMAGDMRYVEKESLRNGELVRFAGRIPEKNAYCEDCGHEFSADLDRLYCPKCTGRRLTPLTGTDLTIKEIEAD